MSSASAPKGPRERMRGFTDATPRARARARARAAGAALVRTFLRICASAQNSEPKTGIDRSELFPCIQGLVHAYAPRCC